MTALLGFGSALGLLAVFIRAKTSFANYDTDSMRLVAHAMASNPLDADAANGAARVNWPYPPGFLPWIALSRSVVGLGPAFAWAVRLPAIGADLAVAWLAQWTLGIHGSSERRRLAVAAMVVLGPVFIATSAVEGQIDALAFLPVALAIGCWDSIPPTRRDLLTGVLLGIGASVKTIPLVLVIAFLPLLPSWRQRLRMAAAAVLVPVVALAPFSLSVGNSAHWILGYRGDPGFGGLASLADPRIMQWAIVGGPFSHSALEQRLQSLATPMVVAAVTVTAIALLRRRPRPADGALTVVLTLYVFGPNMFSQYLVWCVVLLAMSGDVRNGVRLQAAALLPLLCEMLAPVPTGLFWPDYLVTAGTWVWFLCWWLRLVLAPAAGPQRYIRRRRSR